MKVKHGKTREALAEQFPAVGNPTALPRAVVGSDAQRSVGTLRFSSSLTCWFALEWTQAGLALAQTLMSGLFTPLLLSLTPGPIVLPFGLLKQKMMQQMHSHEGTEIKISQMRSGGGEEGSQTSLPAFGGASKARGGDALEWREVRLQGCPDWRVLSGGRCRKANWKQTSSLMVWRARLAFTDWS